MDADAQAKPPLFTNVDMTISASSRICLVGPNGVCRAQAPPLPKPRSRSGHRAPSIGVGKSTLLKVIFSELAPTRGYVTRHNGLRVERFTQHHVDQLNMKKSPLEMFRTEWPSDPVQKVRAHLGSMGITGKLALQPIYTVCSARCVRKCSVTNPDMPSSPPHARPHARVLAHIPVPALILRLNWHCSQLSGGQKSRVALAKITYTKPHLLLLDEPTNHLDLDTVQALIRGLASFSGAVFVISHDEHMITAVCDELWVVEPGRVFSFNGDFEEYKNVVRRKQRL